MPRDLTEHENDDVDNIKTLPVTDTQIITSERPTTTSHKTDGQTEGSSTWGWGERTVTK